VAEVAERDGEQERDAQQAEELGPGDGNQGFGHPLMIAEGC